MCAGMSSGPSSVCVQNGARSGTTTSNQAPKSARTSGEAFSFNVNEAEVCWINRCSIPTRIRSSPWISLTRSRVIRWNPRARGASVIRCCSQITSAAVPSACRRDHRERECPPARGSAADARPARASRRRARSGARARWDHRNREARSRLHAAPPVRHPRMYEQSPPACRESVQECAYIGRSPPSKNKQTGAGDSHTASTGWC